MSFTLDDLLGPAQPDGFEMFGSRTPQPSTSKPPPGGDDMFSDWKSEDKSNKASEKKTPMSFNNLVDFDLDSGFSKFDISMSDLDFADANEDSPKAEPASTRPKLSQDDASQDVSLPPSTNDGFEDKDDGATDYRDCESPRGPENDDQMSEPALGAPALDQDVSEPNDFENRSSEQLTADNASEANQDKSGDSASDSPSMATTDQVMVDPIQGETLEFSEPLKSSEPAEYEHAEPLKPSEPAEPLKPSGSAETLKLSESAETLKPSEPVEKQKPAERINSSEPAERMKPAEAVEPVKISEPRRLKLSEPAQTRPSSQAPDHNIAKFQMPKKSMPGSNEPHPAFAAGISGPSRVSLSQLAKTSVKLSGHPGPLANPIVKASGQARAEAKSTSVSVPKDAASRPVFKLGSLGNTAGVARPIPARVSSLGNLSRSMSLPLNRTASKEIGPLNSARHPAEQRRPTSTTVQTKGSLVKPHSLSARTVVKPGVESPRLSNFTPLKVNIAVEEGAFGSKFSGLKKLPSIATKQDLTPPVQIQVPNNQVDHGSATSSAKSPASTFQFQSTTVSSIRPALENMMAPSLGLPSVSKADVHEAALVTAHPNVEGTKDMVLASSAAEIPTKKQDILQNMEMVAVESGGQVAEVQNKEIAEPAFELEGGATGITELDQLYRMLQRKHEEAKELLVRAMINNNLLRRMCEKYSDENIEKKRQVLHSIFPPTSNEAEE